MIRGRAGVAVLDTYMKDGVEEQRWVQVKSEWQMWDFLGYGAADEARRVLHYGA
jgi:hypothetical protein